MAFSLTRRIRTVGASSKHDSCWRLLKSLMPQECVSVCLCLINLQIVYQFVSVCLCLINLQSCISFKRFIHIFSWNVKHSFPLRDITKQILELAATLVPDTHAPPMAKYALWTIRKKDPMHMVTWAPISHGAESPMRVNRGCTTPPTSTVSRNIAAGRTHRPRSPYNARYNVITS